VIDINVEPIWNNGWLALKPEALLGWISLVCPAKTKLRPQGRRSLDN
jgi:hypothetical protein